MAEDKDGKESVEQNIHQVNAAIAQIASEIKNNTFLFGDNSTSWQLTFDSGNEIADDKEKEIEDLFVIDPAEIETMWRILTENRLLVIGGSPDTGKATTAMYLGRKLADPDKPKVNNRTHIFPTQNRQVRIGLRELCEKDNIFDKRLVIFENALSNENADLKRFFEGVKRGVADISERLHRRSSFLVFTSPTSELNEFQHALAEHNLYHKLSEPGADLLNQGLEKRIEFLAKRLELAEVQMLAEPRLLAEKQMRILREQRQLVLDELKTMPLIANFTEYYYREVIIEGVTITLKEAINHFKDVSYWFLKNLSQDFDVWCFALSLCLSQTMQDARGVPWIAFERLWRTIATCLKHDRVLFPQRPNYQRTDEESPKGNPVLSETFYLDKCRAMIFKDSTGLSDMVRFRDASYASELWKTLLTHCRLILSAILPQLCKIAETDLEAQDLRWRAMAAQIIGRIGELDPEGVTLATMDRWVQAGDKPLWASIGSLYRGALASTNERYRELCLTKLKALTATAGDDKPERADLRTAIITYIQVGVHDLPLAMRELQRIAKLRLEPALGDTQRIERLLDRVEREFDEPLYMDEAIDLLVTHELLRDWAYRLYANEGGIFWGIQFALIALCWEVNPVQVFQELRGWIASSHTMGALVALMFLQEEGIASQLEVYKLPVPKRKAVTDSKQPSSADTSVEIASDEVPNNLNVTAEDGKEDVEKKRQAARAASHSSPASANYYSTVKNDQEVNTISRSNPIVLSLTDGKEAVGQMARFLASVYESVSARFMLPGRSQRYFRISFLQHLKIWIIDAIQVESCKMAMEDLMVELMRIRSGNLYEPIYQLLNSKDFTSQDSELKAFANAVLKRA